MREHGHVHSRSQNRSNRLRCLDPGWQGSTPDYAEFCQRSRSQCLGHSNHADDQITGAGAGIRKLEIPVINSILDGKGALQTTLNFANEAEANAWVTQTTRMTKSPGRASETRNTRDNPGTPYGQHPALGWSSSYGCLIGLRYREQPNVYLVLVTRSRSQRHRCFRPFRLSDKGQAGEAVAPVRSKIGLVGGSLIVDGRMGPMVPVGASAVCSNCHLYPSGRIERSNSVPLRPRPSPNRRHLLPEPHQISSCTLCQGTSGVLHSSSQRRKQHALLSHPHNPRRRWDVSCSSIRSVRS